MKLLRSVLLTIVCSCCTAGGLRDNPAAPMTIGTAQFPGRADADPAGPSSAPLLLELVQNQRQEDTWRTKVVDLLTELVRIQKEVAAHQAQVVQQLGMLGTQGSQQIQDLQNLARHQSLLVENHQALLLQTSRIATHLQDASKKPAPLSQ